MSYNLKQGQTRASAAQEIVAPPMGVNCGELTPRARSVAHGKYATHGVISEQIILTGHGQMGRQERARWGKTGDRRGVRLQAGQKRIKRAHHDAPLRKK